MQAVSKRTPTTNLGVLIPTAGGNNPDVVAAVRLLAQKEPQRLVVLCGRPDSRVGELAARYALIDFIPYELPTGKDGFLATNSLLAFCVLLTRAYSEAIGQRSELPRTYPSLLKTATGKSRLRPSPHDFHDILERQTLLVLHGPATLSAAIDVESKFTEAALGNVQIADYRQFAHGRHHWLAKRTQETAVLSIESADDHSVALQTLRLLPPSIPAQRIQIQNTGVIADLAAICQGFYLVAAAGRLRGIDPGRPGVPSFGRKLYHANAFGRRDSNGIATWKARAIERKAGDNLHRLEAERRLSFWTDALDEALDQVAASRYPAIVLDYDGTLCGEDQRFDPLPSDIAESLTRLLDSQLVIGIATGRGKSVRQRLREAFRKKHWAQITVGYYNGSQILSLASDALPDAPDRVGDELATVAAAIKGDRLLRQDGITLRPKQITISTQRGLSLEALCEHAEAVANRSAPGAVRVMRSGHSVDIVPESVSKSDVVAHIQDLLEADATLPVLRVGDRGRWPGNDSQLLASPYGLSVHEVSSDPRSCWNFAPPGYRGRQATMWYLSRLKFTKRGFRFQLPATAGE
jgi:hypothetical protein